MLPRNTGLENTSYASAVMLLERDPGLAEGTGKGPSLSSDVEALFARQVADWPELGKNVGQLSLLATKDVSIGGTTVWTQFNPARIGNRASFKPDAIKKRPCFLDAQNFPPEERGIPVAGQLVAANPFPILPRHLTIIHPEHVNQSIAPMLEPAIEIAALLGKSYFVFYNGPAVGASAPDHAHIQAGKLPALPIEEDIFRLGPGEALHRDPELSLWLPEQLGRTVIVLESQSADRTAGMIRGIVGRLAVVAGEDEPRLNMVIRHVESDRGGIFRSLIFPRTGFRPPFFYDEDGPKISPASLEMAGLMVVSSKEDYVNVTPDHIRKTFATTSLGREKTLAQIGDVWVKAA